MTKGKANIRLRITTAMLTLCLITLFVSAVFSTIARVRLQSLLEESGMDISAIVSDMSSEALSQLSISQTQDFIAAKVEVMDVYIKKIKDNLTIVRDYTANIYNTPKRFIPDRVQHYRNVQDGVFVPHYSLDPEVTLTPKIRDEINMLYGMIYTVEAMMKLNSEIFSMYIVTESGAAVFFDDQSGKKKFLTERQIRLRERPWYLDAKRAGAVSVTDTYEDAAGRGLCVTFSIPVYRQNGLLAGIIGADIGMRELSKTAEDITASGVDFVMLLGKDRIIASSILEEAEGAAELPPGHYEILANRSGAIRRTVPLLTSEERVEIESYIIWNSLTLTDWKLVGFTPVAGVIAPAEKMRASIGDITNNSLKTAQNTAAATSLATLLSFVGILVFGLFYARKTSRRISSPLVSLTNDAMKIGRGELDNLLEVKTGDEIETLADTINKMVTDIKSITADKERIGAELDVATKIQASMLPCIFPAFPHRPEFDIYATMIPAKEVGGDFYDFFLIGEDKLALVAADVSGKGVPAALFMVIAKTLIKNNAQYGKTPKEVFETVNNLLCENNEAGMFVTAFMGIWEMKTGVFTYVNAGHNPPLMKRAGGNYEWLNTMKPGLVLAGMEGMVYKQDEITLYSGDTIYMYTDGITEAVNPQNELFSDRRLFETVNRHKTSSLNEFVDQVKAEIDKFADGAEQADDITMLVMRVTGGAQ